jgi:WD40 repeat protein
MPDLPGPSAEDSAVVFRAIDSAADQFESAWRDGASPNIEDYLPASSELRRPVLQELVMIDLEYRRRRGEPRKVEDYLDRFPELLQENGRLPDALLRHADELEKLARSRSVTPAAGGDALFCPDCHAMIPRPPGTASLGDSHDSPSGTLHPGEGPASDVICPTCGRTVGPVLASQLSEEMHRTIGGYQLLQEVGRGGLGRVYKAYDARLRREVAIKMLSGPYADKDALARFRREAEVPARLQHPNIVQVFDVGEQEGVSYIVMEFMRGGNLKVKLAGEPIPSPDAAHLVATLARTMQFAHTHGIVHRDLKPANVLLTEEGIPRISDFGLAQLPQSGAENLTQSGAIVGTPAYMAPEQAQPGSQAISVRTDIWALGAMLYEMLSGRPPFRAQTYQEVLRQVVTDEPVPPRRLQPKVSRDLETICLKCLQKEPQRRYATAGELADDLHRFLDGEPIRARPVSSAERLWRWCRRRPVIASLMAALAINVLLTCWLVVYFAIDTTRQVRDADAKRDRLQGELAASQGDLALSQVELACRPPHVAGWSQTAWKGVAEAAAQRSDDRLRDLVVAALEGLDARLTGEWNVPGAGSVACGPDGKLWLLGDTAGPDDRNARPAVLIDGATGEMKESAGRGSGPVAFRPDGTPLQLVAGEGLTLRVWDVARQARVSECRFAPGTDLPEVTALARNAVGPTLALSADGSRAAAAAVGPGGKGRLAVWDARTGELLIQVAARVRALTFSADGARLAAADEDGAISLRAVPKDKPIARFAPAGPATLHGLAFSPDGARLAAAGSGGTVILWECASGLATACRGSADEVYAVAFSPDGLTLASGGRFQARLWDTATDRLLLELPSADPVVGLAFAPDGRRLGVTSRAPSGVGHVAFWNLAEGRGVQALRGLASPAAQVGFSGDGRWLAARGGDGRLAVWELATGRLRQLLNTSTGPRVNFALSPDGNQLALAGNEAAALWDLTEGKRIASWNLPPGQDSVLTFAPSGRLLLFRAERPHDLASPWVGRVRELRPGEPARVLAEIEGLDFGISGAGAVRDGGFAAVARPAEPGGEGHRLVVFDAVTGKTRWSYPLTEQGNPVLRSDPAGRILAVWPCGDADKASLFDTDSGKFLASSEWMPVALGPEAGLLVRSRPPAPSGLPGGFSLYARDGEGPLVALGVGGAPSSQPVFDASGDRLAWGNADGTISVPDLPQIRARLAAVGLAW